MAHYRLYTLRDDGNILSADDLQASDDGEAIQLVRIRLEHRDIDLWRGTRRVALVPKDSLPIFVQNQRATA